MLFLQYGSEISNRMQLTAILRYLPDIIFYIKYFYNVGINDNGADGTCRKHGGLEKCTKY